MKPADIEKFGNIATELANGEIVIIRPLQKTDGNALASFYASVPREDFRFYCPHPLDDKHAAENTSKAESPCEIVLIAENAQKEIAGYAWLRWQNENSDCSTFGICIRRTYQGRGLGQSLMSELFKIGKKIAPPVVHLTVQKANAKGFNLYSKMGFKIIKEQIRPANFQPGLQAEPEYMMELRLR
mgnify:CR=1 FL=1